MGLRGNSPLTLLIVLLFPMMLPVSGYDYSGTITENGDNLWDPNEYAFLPFTVGKDESFEISFSASGDLLGMFCNCETPQDIEGILQDIASTGNSVNAYFLFDTTTLSNVAFIPDSRVSGNIAIFTYNPTNPAVMQYTLSTNIESGTGGGINPLIVVAIAIAVIAVGVFLYIRYQQSQQGPSPYYQSPPITNQDVQATSSQPPTGLVVYCGNCGKAGNTRFCEKCGTPLNYPQE